MLPEPIPVKFGDFEESARLDYVYDNITDIKRGLKEVTEEKLPKWRKAYEGKPEDPQKTFPWRGSSNIVVQLIAASVETLKAQVMASIYEVLPIWNCITVGDWGTEANADEQRGALDRFLNLMSMEPAELDLYRVESIWFSSAIKYGFSVLKSPYMIDTEDFCVGSDIDHGPVYRQVIKHYGPRPEVVPFEDFGVNPTATTLDNANFKYHIVHLNKYQLMERKFLKLYDTDKVNKILALPDGSGATRVEREKQEDTGARTQQSKLEERWDIFECHYPYWVKLDGENRKLSIIETYHYGSKTSLRAVYNWYPENMNIFTGARLGYSDRGLYELGYCEMLEHAQKEVTAEHNRYADNGTLANTSIFRVDPEVSTRLDASFSMFPLAMLPAREGEFEVLNIGRQNDTGIDRERQNLDLVTRRTGLDSGMVASGGGTTNPKKGVYSAMGTFSAMQAGNKRSNMNQSDFKASHIELGRKFSHLYAEFGIDPLKYKQYGNDEKWLRMAFENVKKGRLNIPVRGSTGSINKEMEKQSDMLMVNIMRQHYMGITQILQNLPNAPQHMQDYLVNVILANDYLMKHFLRNFGYDDISRLLPEPAIIKQLKEQQANAEQQRQQSTGDTGTNGSDAGTTIPTERIQSGDGSEQGSGTEGSGGVQQDSLVPVS